MRRMRYLARRAAVALALTVCAFVLVTCGSHSRSDHAQELLSAKYGEQFVVDKNYGAQNVPGFDVFPFVIFEDYYTVAAHSASRPELVVEAHFSTKDDSFDDNYADLCVADNTSEYLADRYLQSLDGAYYLDVDLTLSGVADPVRATGLCLHEVDGACGLPSVALYFAPASGEVSSREMYDLAVALNDYVRQNAPDTTIVTSVFLLDETAGVARVRDYVRGNRIGNYSTSDWQDAMGVAWAAGVKYSATTGETTSFDEFDWEKLYPNQDTPRTIIN